MGQQKGEWIMLSVYLDNCPKSMCLFFKACLSFYLYYDNHFVLFFWDTQKKSWTTKN